MAHAAESLHWYTRSGQPAYTVKAKAGHDRPTTLADARKLGLVPSVTTIIKSAAAPGLERWKLDQMLHAALTLPRVDGEAEKDYIGRIWLDSQETARKAAERGTNVHAAIQGFFQKEPVSPDYQEHIQSVCDVIRDWAGETFDHECCLVEQSFAHPLGFGGKTDFMSTSPYLVVDFKTKEFGPSDDLKTWDEHAMQLAAYKHGLGMPEETRCAIVYVSVTHPGHVRLLEIKPSELKKGWTMFFSLLHYWKAKNGIETAFERLAA